MMNATMVNYVGTDNSKKKNRMGRYCKVYLYYLCYGKPSRIKNRDTRNILSYLL